MTITHRTARPPGERSERRTAIGSWLRRGAMLLALLLVLDHLALPQVAGTDDPAAG